MANGKQTTQHGWGTMEHSILRSAALNHFSTTKTYNNNNNPSIHPSIHIPKRITVVYSCYYALVFTTYHFFLSSCPPVFAFLLSILPNCFSLISIVFFFHSSSPSVHLHQFCLHYCCLPTTNSFIHSIYPLPPPLPPDHPSHHSQIRQ